MTQKGFAPILIALFLAAAYEEWRQVRETEFKVHVTLSPSNVGIPTLKAKGPLLSYSDVYPICN